MQFQLEVFEGPLDLLLNLVSKEKVDIREVSITEIADQYLKIIEEDPDQTSEFILMASTLLAIKSKRILPKLDKLQDDLVEVDLEEDLIDRLIEYSQFKDLGEKLLELEKKRKEIYIPCPTKIYNTVDEVDYLKNVSPEKLLEVFKEVLKSIEPFTPPILVEQEKITVSECIEFILKEINTVKKLSFKSFMEQFKTKEYIVTTFLAMLELIKLNKIVCLQNHLFDDIMITEAGVT